VKIIYPFIGYSAIIIETTGDGNIYAHGFTKQEVTNMKGFILSKI